MLFGESANVTPAFADHLRTSCFCLHSDDMGQSKKWSQVFIFDEKKIKTYYFVIPVIERMVVSITGMITRCQKKSSASVHFKK